MSPVNAHMEDTSHILRFVEIQCDSGEIKKAFINFISLEVKSAGIITVEITNKLG
jgi:hypothetical protein